VIGNGNVAIDVARMLVLDPDELAVTDTADHALEALGRSQVHEVILLGRRGPAQAAFTSPELRELGELMRADVYVDPDELELDEHSEAAVEAKPAVKRNVDVLRDYAERDPRGHQHRLELRFLTSPVEIVGEGEDGPVTAIRVVRNKLDADQRPVPTGEEETIACGLVLRSIGYRGEPLPGVPFDEKRGVILNEGGRITDGAPGEYAVGWIKRGPSGIIGTNKKDAHETTAKVVEDRDAGRLNEPSTEPTEEWVRERVPGLVTWNGWEAIDAHEKERGEPHGRPRVKLVSKDEMRDIAGR
jgi:ferredoxin/flavodoxin---NADP+ reductase